MSGGFGILDILSDEKELRLQPWMESGEYEFILVTDANITECIDACIGGRFSLDLETTGIDNRVFDGETKDKIVGVCLSGDGIRGWYIPLRHKVGAEHNVPWSVFDREFRRLIDSVMAGESVAIFHNGKFDQEFLEFNGGEPYGDWTAPKRWEDTLILAYLRHSRSRRKGLKPLSEAPIDADNTHPTGGPGLGMKMLELEDLFPEGHPKSQYDYSLLNPAEKGPLIYGCSDAICTYKLCDLLWPAVLEPKEHPFNQRNIYRIEKACVAGTRWMERNRILTDPDKVMELIKLGQQEWFDSIMDVYGAAEEILGRDVMPGFYKVVRDYWVADDPMKLLRDQLMFAKSQAEARYPNPIGKATTRGVKWPLIYDVNAPKQLGQMFEEMGVPGLVYTEKSQLHEDKSKWQVKTAKDVLERVIAEAEARFPFMAKIKRFREVNKALSSYLFPMLEDVDPNDHTMRISFNAHKVDTGRFSTPARGGDLSSERKKRIAGWPAVNLQSVPATYDPRRPQCMTRIRECIVARPGYYVVACVAEGSLVPTHRGLIRIEDVEAGDKVWTEAGLQEVSATSNNGVQPVVEIVTERGFRVKVTPDHLVRTVDATGLTWRQAGHLRMGDWVVQVWGDTPSRTITLPVATVRSVYEQAITTPQVLTRDLAEVLGRFMGDGHVGHLRGDPRSIGFALGEDVVEILPVLNRKMVALFGLTCSEKAKGDTHVWSNPLARWFKQVTGKVSTKKAVVPPVVLAAGTATQAAFLRGLFDADGSISTRPGDGVTIAITSKVMAQQVHQMLLGCGVPSRIKPVERETNFGHWSGWLLTVSGATWLATFSAKVGFITTRKQQALRSLVLSERQDSSERFPWPLACAAVVRQRHPATNRVHSYGRRRGQVSRQLLERAAQHPDDVDETVLSRLLDTSWSFDRVVSVEPLSKARVFDLTVPGAGHFQAGGLVVHNCDFAGEELRLVTNLSREPKWLDEFFRCSSCSRTFNRGDGASTPAPPPARCPNCGSDKIGDLHTLTALEIYGKDATRRPEWKQLRGNAKGTNFALCYGGGGNAVVRAIGDITKNEGWRIKNQFDGTYGGLKMWWAGQHRFAHKYGFVLTSFGRIYPVPDIWSADGGFRSKAERNSVNGPIQGCLHGDSRVPTSIGVRRLEDLSGKTFRVWTGTQWSDGRAFPSGLKRLIHTTLTSGLILRTSPDHRFRVHDATGLTWVRQEDLTPGMWVVTDTKGINLPEQTLIHSDDGSNAHNKKGYEFKGNHEALWELLGLVIGDGDGSIRNDGLILHVGGQNAAKQAHFYADRFTEALGLRPTVSEKRRPEGDDRLPMWQVCFWNKAFRDFCLTLGLEDWNTYTKRVPEAVWGQSAKHQAAFLRGYFSADGCVNVAQAVDVRSVNHALLMDTHKLLRSIGIRSTVRLGSKRVSIKDRVAFRNHVGFLIPDKSDRLASIKSNPWTGQWHALPPNLITRIGDAVYNSSIYAGLTRPEKSAVLRLKIGSGSKPQCSRYLAKVPPAEVPPDITDLLLYDYEQVVWVEDTGDQVEMFDIEVFDDEHAFVCDGVVVHNSGADVIKIATALIYKAIKKKGWLDLCRMFASMHDELVFEIHGSIIEEAIAVITPCLTSNPFIMAKKWPVPLTIDCEIGTDWTVKWDLNEMLYREVRFEGDKKLKEPRSPRLADYESATEFDEAETTYKGAIAAWKAMPHSFPASLRPFFKVQVAGGATPATPPTTSTPVPVPDPAEPAAVPADAPAVEVPGQALEPSHSEVMTRVSLAPDAEAPGSKPPSGLAPGAYYDFVLRAPMTPMNCIRLAKVIEACRGGGTRKLRIKTPSGALLEGWSTEEYMVNDQQFYWAAQQKGL